VALKDVIESDNPFLDNKYTKWYMELISKDCNDDYVERHHILPKSLYPEYAKCKWNIVKLSARKHFIAHILLYKMFEHNTKGYGTMLKATRMMGRHSTNNRYMNSRLYETAKIKCSKYVSETQRWSEEHKKKISDKLKGIIRGPMSEEAKKKMVASKKAKHVPKIWMNKDEIQTKVRYEKINDYLLSGWTKGTSRKHLTEDYKLKMKQNAIKQWQEVKASGYKTKSKNNRIQSCL
jgi:hypothetical protein